MELVVLVGGIRARSTGSGSARSPMANRSCISCRLFMLYCFTSLMP